MKMKHLIRLAVIVLITISCSPKAAEQSANFEVTALSSLEKAEVIEAPQQTSYQSKQTNYAKKIIKDGRLGIKVNELNAAKSIVDTLVKSVGGYYESENLQNNDYSSEYDLKIRIPSNKFEIFISKIEKGENTVMYKEIQARDITEEYYDLETRLSNKQKYMLRYQDLLKMAKSMKEILDIQEKIRVLEEEIESTTGKLKYLSDQVNYSTLALNITKQKEYKYTPSHRENFFEKLKKSFAGGWYSLVDFILFLIGNWAYIIILSVLIYYWVKYRRNKKEKRNK